MRNLIPRLQVVVARDRSRADRVLSGLFPGSEVFLTRQSREIYRVTDHQDPALAQVLGVVTGDGAGRIATAEASGRQCRAWFVGALPMEKSPDGAYRMVLSVWCSSLTGRGGWREISAQELVQAARLQDEPLPAARPAARAADRPAALDRPSAAPSLSVKQMDLIKDAVRRRLTPPDD